MRNTLSRTAWLWPSGVVLAVLAFLTLSPPIPQDESFHRFADDRTIAGIPNFWNVISNLPFVIVGMFGLRKSTIYADRVLFFGILMTGVGSAYYHLSPGDGRLVWDRLPMTIIFMAFISAAIAAEHNTQPDTRLLAVLLAVGAASVLWWGATGDLRAYAAVKFSRFFTCCHRCGRRDNGRLCGSYSDSLALRRSSKQPIACSACGSLSAVTP